MKTALIALLLAAPVGVAPQQAAVGETIVVSGPAGDVELVPLDAAGPARPLGRVGASGELAVAVPDVPAGRYRVVVGGAGEAPVLEVVALSQETSLLLVAFGLLLVLALVVAGVVVHRRWRDAVS